MTNPYKDDKLGAEPDITITNAVPAGPAPTQEGPPVPAGHQRFYCEKCRTVREPLEKFLLVWKLCFGVVLECPTHSSLLFCPSLSTGLRFATTCDLLAMCSLFDL
jgi:hypothetical protein